MPDVRRMVLNLRDARNIAQLSVFGQIDVRTAKKVVSAYEELARYYQQHKNTASQEVVVELVKSAHLYRKCKDILERNRSLSITGLRNW